MRSLYHTWIDWWFDRPWLYALLILAVALFVTYKRWLPTVKRNWEDWVALYRSLKLFFFIPLGLNLVVFALLWTVAPWAVFPLAVLIFNGVPMMSRRAFGL